MNTNKKKQKTQFSRQCILCGNPGVTKQHVFPDWLRAHFPRLETKFSGFKTRMAMGAGHAVIAPHLPTSRNGDIGAHKLQVLCRNCNNVWASGIENEARDYLIPMIKGDRVNLDLKAQESLATWLTLFTTVAEYDDVWSKAITEAQRFSFRSTGLPSSDWKIWIGRRDFGFEERLAMRHRGFKLGDRMPPELPDPGAPANFNIQTTAVLIGTFMGYVVSSPNYDFAPLDLEQETGGLLKQIWPPTGRSILLPTGPGAKLTIDTVRRVSDLYSQPAFKVIVPKGQ